MTPPRRGYGSRSSVNERRSGYGEPGNRHAPHPLGSSSTGTQIGSRIRSRTPTSTSPLNATRQPQGATYETSGAIWIGHLRGTGTGRVPLDDSREGAEEGRRRQPHHDRQPAEGRRGQHV